MRTGARPPRSSGACLTSVVDEPLVGKRALLSPRGLDHLLHQRRERLKLSRLDGQLDHPRNSVRHLSPLRYRGHRGRCLITAGRYQPLGRACSEVPGVPPNERRHSNSGVRPPTRQAVTRSRAVAADRARRCRFSGPPSPPARVGWWRRSRTPRRGLGRQTAGPPRAAVAPRLRPPGLLGSQL